MSHVNNHPHRLSLQQIAHKAMLDRGLLPDFSPQIMAELDKMYMTAVQADDKTRDLRELLWCSIDNDSSRDLDQLSVTQSLPNGAVKVLVAIADVDSLVKKQSAIDIHAQHNTVSVYTAAQIFPMLPEKLSTGLTSLNDKSERHAIVIEMVFNKDAALVSSDIYPAIVYNRAKLAYNSVAAWLDGNGPIPQAIADTAGMEENIRLHDVTAHKLKALRHIKGSLDFETIEVRPVYDGDVIISLEVEESNRAKSIIEEVMIAANGVSARFLETKKFPSVRRIVRTPKHWDKIVELAAQHKFKLPQMPDSKSLEDFLTKEKAANPDSFSDLSLSVIKLMGPGEYVVEVPGKEVIGHFGLAVKDYTHSTAPNRRFPDIIIQRLLKAAIAGIDSPYATGELDFLAKHCTEMENAAKKVERQVVKSAAAILLESRTGEKFDAIVTGASGKGTWVRITNPPVEGRLINGNAGIRVGNRLQVKLISVDVERGFIDFEMK